MKKTFLLIIFFVLPVIIFSSENPANTEKIKQYDKEKITFEFKEQFDVMYPANIKIFYFKKGNQPITFDEFLKLTNDSYLLKTNDRIKRIKISGFTTTAIFGVTTGLLLIPSIIYIAKQTNNDPIDSGFVITGNICIVLAGASLLGMIIGLTVTFSLLYRYKFNVDVIRRAVEEYNEKLREKLGILPDISFNRYLDNDLSFSLSYKF